MLPILTYPSASARNPIGARTNLNSQPFYSLSFQVSSLFFFSKAFVLILKLGSLESFLSIISASSPYSLSVDDEPLVYAHLCNGKSIEKTLILSLQPLRAASKDTILFMHKVRSALGSPRDAHVIKTSLDDHTLHCSF